MVQASDLLLVYDASGTEVLEQWVRFDVFKAALNIPGGGSPIPPKMADSNSGGRIGDIVGAINGVNTTFTLPDVYVAGSLEILLNGQDQNMDDIIETNPGSKIFDLTFAPKTGMYMKARYV